jgi:hypothetical protein
MILPPIEGSGGAAGDGDAASTTGDRWAGAEEGVNMSRSGGGEPSSRRLKMCRTIPTGRGPTG